MSSNDHQSILAMKVTLLEQLWCLGVVVVADGGAVEVSQ